MSDFLLLYQLSGEHGGSTIATKQSFDQGCNQLRRLARDSGAEFEAFCEGPLWCARQRTAQAPATPIVADEAAWIFTDGPISYQGEALGHRTMTSLLAAIRKDPASAARTLDGVFTVVAYEGPGRRLIVIPSALGMRGLYLRHLPGGVLGISSSILALAALGPVTLDEFSFRALFRCGHRLPPHTLFHEVRSVAEGCLLVMNGHGMDAVEFWKPEFNHPHPSKIEDCAWAVGSEMERYCNALIEPSKPVFSDFTGGYDSRVSTAALAHAGIPFVATVAGSNDHPDVVTARKICDAEGIELRVVDPAPDAKSLASEVEDALRLSEGSLDAFTFASTLRVKNKLFQASGQLPVYTVSGALGECYRDFYWSQEFLNRGKRQDASIDRIIRYRMDFAPCRMDLFARDWRPVWRDQLQTWVEAIVDRYHGERNTSQIDAVYLRKMAGMMGSFATASGRISGPVTPFGALPALNMTLSVPPEWRFDARLLRQVSWFLNPKLANHMTLSGRPCAPVNRHNFHRFLPKYWLDAQRAIRKFSTVWLGKTIFPEYREALPPVNPYAAFLEEESKPGGCLDYDSMYTAHLYDRPTFLHLLRQAREPQGSATCVTISKIYTCEAMLRAASDGFNFKAPVMETPSAEALL